MMLSKVDSGKSSGEDPSSGRLLRDIDEISKALYLRKTPPKALISPSHHRSQSAGKTRFSESKSKVVIEDFLHKNKKSSIWNWKPLKALTHVRNHRFNCCFFLHVHAIEGLPSIFNDLSLCVNWKRKDEVLRTRPYRVCQRMVEFDETLMHRCSVYSSRNGAQHLAKFEPKLFLLYASVIGAPGLDIGKHWIDLTKLLPLNLEELEKEKRSSGKWTTSFKLIGKAKGAMLNVSFGFSIVDDFAKFGRTSSSGMLQKLGSAPSNSKHGDNLSMSSSYVKVPDLLKGNGPGTVDHFANFGQIDGSGMLRRLGSVPSNSNHGSHISSQSLDIKILNEVLPNRATELARSITSLYQKLDERNIGDPEEFDFFYEHLEPFNSNSGSLSETTGDDTGNEGEETEFTVIEQGIELSMNEQLKLKGEAVQSFDGSVIEAIDVTEIFKGDGTALGEETECNTNDEVFGNYKDEGVIGGSGYKENDACNREPTGEELESVCHNLSISESTELDSSLDICTFLEQEDYIETKLSYKAGTMVKSLSLDDVAESVTNDFLNILGIEQNIVDFYSDGEPESPREHLLRQFEKEALASGNSIFYFDAMAEQEEVSGATPTTDGKGDQSDDFDLSSVIQAAEKEHSRERQSLISKRKAKMLENLETETLMREWGLNEKAFHNSPRTCSDGFGSPVYFFPEERPELPPLGEGLDPIIRTKAGGFLRSMNPSLLKNAKNGANLIMQVSAPVVLPVALGSSMMEILQCWASVGVEKMCMQANELMPLEDISGKTMPQVVWEAASSSEVQESWLLLHESEVGNYPFVMREKVEELPAGQGSSNLNSSSIWEELDSEYVHLEDLSPLAMAKIEALSIEGLRIQSNMSDEEAPSSIKPQASGTSVKFGGSLSSEGAAGLPIQNLKDTGDNVDELLSLTISFDEWIRLDAGIFYSKDEINGRIFKILEAYHAKSLDLNSVMTKRESEWGEPSVGRHGLLGNNFTVALKLQLEDPFRDHESVGAPMLALIQVERVYVTLEQEVNNRESERSCNWEEDNRCKQLIEEEDTQFERKEKSIKGEFIPRFKIAEVHVAGLNDKPREKQLWGTRTQQQSGSRWLLSSDMGKTKGPFSKSNAIVKSSSQMMRKAKLEDTLWSISSHVHVAGAKWKEFATLNIHVRNPDIVFPNETIRFPKV